MVVRSHIYVENRINEYLEETTPRPEQLAGLGLRYRQKAQLACALGFDPDFLKPLIVLGEIRNKFSHRLDTSLTPELVGNLYEALPPFGTQVVERSLAAIRTELHAEGVVSPVALPPRDLFILITLSLERVVFGASTLIRESRHTA